MLGGRVKPASEHEPHNLACSLGLTACHHPRCFRVFFGDRDGDDDDEEDKEPSDEEEAFEARRKKKAKKAAGSDDE